MQCLSVSLYVKKIIRECSLTKYLEIQTQHFFHNQNKELLWTINKVYTCLEEGNSSMFNN